MAMDLSGFVRRKTTIKIGTKDFTFTELCLADIANFKGHLVKQRKILNEERRVRLLENAEKIGGIDPLELLKLSDSSISEEEFEAQLDTLEGVGYLAYLSLKEAHPEISIDNAMEILSISSFDEILRALYSEDTAEKDLDKKKVRMRIPLKKKKKKKKSPNPRR